MDFTRHVENVVWGTYYFFRFQVGVRVPGIRPIMEAGDLVGSLPVQLVVAFLTLTLLLLKRKVGSAFVVLMITAAAFGLFEGLHFLVPSSRPPIDPQSTLLTADDHRSFPAAPVLLSFVTLLNLDMALADWLSLRRRRVTLGVLLMVALWVTLSQLVLGLHFLNDVIAGMTAGIGLALICRALALPRTVPAPEAVAARM